MDPNMVGGPEREGNPPYCPACGRSVDRAAAREYDKFGDRWDRRDKEFEYLCKPCHQALCHQNRDELEALLLELDAGCVATDEFLDRYVMAVEDRYGPVEER